LGLAKDESHLAVDTLLNSDRLRQAWQSEGQDAWLGSRSAAMATNTPNHDYLRNVLSAPEPLPFGTWVMTNLLTGGQSGGGKNFGKLLAERWKNGKAMPTSDPTQVAQDKQVLASLGLKFRSAYQRKYLMMRSDFPHSNESMLPRYTDVSIDLSNLEDAWTSRYPGVFHAMMDGKTYPTGAVYGLYQILAGDRSQANSQPGILPWYIAHPYPSTGQENVQGLWYEADALLTIWGYMDIEYTCSLQDGDSSAIRYSAAQRLQRLRQLLITKLIGVDQLGTVPLLADAAGNVTMTSTTMPPAYDFGPY
jgi:hypothetical protein